MGMGDLIPTPIQPLLAEYRALLERDTFALVAGCYLHGSIALGAFDPAQSDIDFVAVLSRPCTPEELQTLATLHQTLAEKYPQWQMEGSYLQATELGRTSDEISPHPCFHDGNFNPAGKHDINPVTWWLLKTRAIPLFGADPQTLNVQIEWETVRAYTHANLNTYWRRWAYDPRYMLALQTDWAIQWAVLGVLRLHYSLQTNQMTSKVGAGDYGLQTLPPQWHRLIQEALRLRQKQPHSLYRFRLQRTIEAMRFLRMVIRNGNK
jgi:hypothetical protein